MKDTNPSQELPGSSGANDVAFGVEVQSVGMISLGPDRVLSATRSLAVLYEFSQNSEEEVL